MANGVEAYLFVSDSIMIFYVLSLVWDYTDVFVLRKGQGF